MKEKPFQKFFMAICFEFMLAVGLLNKTIRNCQKIIYDKNSPRQVLLSQKARNHYVNQYECQKI